MVLLTEAIIKGKTRLDRLDEVRNLNLWGQDISDVSTLQRMPSVEVLSLSVNAIASLKEFMHCKNLKELYLRKNMIASLSDIRFLMPLPHLKVLWLSDNPCAELPNYRQLVIANLPQLEKLDNIEVTQADRQAAQHMPLLQPATSAELLADAGPDTPDAAAGCTPQAQALDPNTQTPPRAHTPAAASTAAVERSDASHASSRASVGPAAAAAAAASLDSYGATIGVIVPSKATAAAGAGLGGGSSGALPCAELDLCPQQQQEQQRYYPQQYSSHPGKQVQQPHLKALHVHDQHMQQQQQQQMPAHGSSSSNAAGSARPSASSNVLYAVIALLADLDASQLLIVQKEVEQRLAWRLAWQGRGFD